MILRVFPRRSKQYTPDDRHAFVCEPPLWTPAAHRVSEVHISVCFTWDKDRAERILKPSWEMLYPGKVRVGGPAYQSPCDTFTPCRYVKAGITYTSRGCDDRCPWCLVPEWEGRLRTLDHISPGRVVQDNNLLACPKAHRRRVYDMLAGVPTVQFKGGLAAGRLTAWDAARLRSLRVNEMWFACDTVHRIGALRKALRLLGGVSRNVLRCYVLCGFDAQETVEDAEARLVEVWEAGATPFCQLYRSPTEAKRREWPDEWRHLARAWSRPAATKARARQLLGSAR